MAKTRRSMRLTVPTRAYCFPITERTLTRSASLHFIAFSAGETTTVVKTTPPSHTPAKTTCSVCTIGLITAPPCLFCVPRIESLATYARSYGTGCLNRRQPVQAHGVPAQHVFAGGLGFGDVQLSVRYQLPQRLAEHAPPVGSAHPVKLRHPYAIGAV